MNKNYSSIADTVKADLDRVDKNLNIEIYLPDKAAKEINDFLKLPSKKLRTVVSLLYMRASKMYLIPEHYELFAAVEIMHNVSLIHDDVIDNGKLRRGQKTLNEKLNNQLAVISGDYLLSAALKKLAEINSIEIINIFSDTLADMCKGEFLQNLNKNKITSLEEYIEKSSLKTSSLFKAALKSAVILADGYFDEKISEFADNFGLAFQIRDDLMNILNKDKSKYSSDIDDGIYNAPLILDKDFSAGVEKTKVLLNNYVNCAKQCIEDLENSPYKKALFELLELVANV